MLLISCLRRSDLRGLTQTGSEVAENRPAVYPEQSRAGWHFWDTPESFRSPCCGNARIISNGSDVMRSVAQTEYVEIEGKTGK